MNDWATAEKAYEEAFIEGQKDENYDPSGALNKSLLKQDSSSSGSDKKEKKKKQATSNDLYRLLRYAYPERGIMAIATVGLLMGSLFTLGIPAVVGMIIDIISNPDADPSELDSLTRLLVDLGFGDSSETLLLVAISLLAGLSLAAAICAFVRGWLFTLAGERVVARIRNELFAKLVSLDIR
jgi:ABC-type bacteriocin/lantibiotic exporter with double-glycine peptidase domain